jgi:SOS-response transcriptional repressor LexA
MEKKVLSELQNAMHRIRSRRLDRGWSQRVLAEECGWEDAGRISNYENLSREPALADLHKMAQAVGLTLKEALFGENLVKNEDDKKSTGYVQLPLLRMDEIADWISGNLTQIKRSYEMYIADINVSKKRIAVIMEGDAMESPSKIKQSICDGEVMTVEVDRIPVPRDTVIAIANGETIVREYAKDGTKLLLKAYNPAYQHINLTEDVKIVGVVVGNQVLRDS